MSTLPIPGTVRLVDIHHNLQGLRHGNKNSDIILIPQPSDDPDDPLNWTPKRKLLSTISGFTYIFIAAITSCSITPALVDIVNETGIPLGNINTGTGLMYLFMGWANVIVQSLALNYGRRPILLISSVAATAIALWTSYVRTTTEWYLNRIILGIAIAPVETLIEITFADVQFSHERGFYLSVYNWALWNIPFLAPIASGFVAQRWNWQWIMYITTIISGVCTIFLFFTLEETMFYRAKAQEEFIDDENVISKEKTPDTNSNNSPSAKGDKGISTEITDRDVVVGEMTSNKTYLQRMKLWSSRHPDQPNSLWRDMILPFTLLRFPGITFAGLVVGGSLSWFNVVNGTLALILSSPPYNLSSNMIGVFCISCVIGITIGCYLAGSLSDWLAMRMAQRNKGLREPEHRLWLAAIPVLLHPAGCILYGAGAENGIHWIGIAFGLGFISLCLPYGANLAFNYVLDSYKELGGQAIVTTILYRNTMGFGFGYAIVPMINSLGLQNTFITLAFLGMAFFGMSFFMIAFGKDLRKQSAPAYWKLLEEVGATIH